MKGLEIRTYLSAAINSPMSGNMIDICPVGALNASPSHMKGRTWELEEIKSVSAHDCIGSNINMHISDNNVFSVVPREKTKKSMKLGYRIEIGFHMKQLIMARELKNLLQK